jgi:hypothetical protein
MRNLEIFLLNSSIGRGAICNSLFLYRNIIPRFLGEYAVQLGFSKIKYLHYANHPHKYYLDKTHANILIDIRQIPLKTESVDLVIIPFIDLYIININEIIFESYRILKPNGKLVISAINPSSILGLYTQLKGHNYNLTSSQLQNILNQYNFSIDSANFINYGYNLSQPFKFFNSNKYNLIGNRWFPNYANLYSLVVTKNITNPLIDNILYNNINTASLLK